jgi:hypothetical protein
MTTTNKVLFLLDSCKSPENARIKNNEQVQVLANELNTVLGSQKLVSMTSSATNGIVVTTIAYEEE